jgi:membrane-associated phospholipid phosphatase
MIFLSFLENISKSFLLIFIVPLLLGFYNTVYWWIIVGVVIFDVFLGIIKHSVGNKEKVFQRPQGASACNIFCLPSNDEGKPGFPSGHVATTTMMMLILVYFIHDIYFTVFALIYIVLMALSRYSKKCHNLTQITCGLIFGIIGALVFIQQTPKEIWT